MKPYIYSQIIFNELPKENVDKKKKTNYKGNF